MFAVVFVLLSSVSLEWILREQDSGGVVGGPAEAVIHLEQANYPTQRCRVFQDGFNGFHQLNGRTLPRLGFALNHNFLKMKTARTRWLVLRTTPIAPHNSNSVFLNMGKTWSSQTIKPPGWSTLTHSCKTLFRWIIGVP